MQRCKKTKKKQTWHFKIHCGCDLPRHLFPDWRQLRDFLTRHKSAAGSSPGQEHVLCTAGQQSHSTPIERLPKTLLKGGPSSRFYSLSGTVAAIQPPTRLGGAILIASHHDEWPTACGERRAEASSEEFRTERVPVSTAAHSCSGSANMLV